MLERKHPQREVADPARLGLVGSRDDHEIAALRIELSEGAEARQIESVCTPLTLDGIDDIALKRDDEVHFALLLIGPVMELREASRDERL